MHYDVDKAGILRVCKKYWKVGADSSVPLCLDDYFVDLQDGVSHSHEPAYDVEPLLVELLSWHEYSEIAYLFYVDSFLSLKD